MRVGLLGGSFDPLHLGHLALGEEARETLNLDKLLFVPAGAPWMKRRRKLADGLERLEMVRLAVSSNPCFGVSSLEVERPGPTYSVDTLEELHRQAGGRNEYYFILGADVVEDVGRWKEPARVLELCTLVVAYRPGYGQPDLATLDAVQPGASAKAILLDTIPLDISSTGVRRRVARGRSVRYLVPPEVDTYIREHGLYRDEGMDGEWAL